MSATPGPETVRAKPRESGNAERHPYDFHHRSGDALRPPPPRVRNTPRYLHVRKFLLGGLREIEKDVLPGGLDDYRARYDDQFWEGDALMDDVVAAFRTVPNGGGRKLFDQALKHGLSSIENPPEAFVALFDQLETEPDWLNWEMLERGARIFTNLPAFYSLMNGVIDTVFTTNSAAVSLATGATGRFTRQKENRFIESFTLFTNMCMPGGMRRSGAGFATCVHIRLMHAFVRSALFNKKDLFAYEVHGNPISSADSLPAGPLFGIGLFLVRRGFGARIRQDEMEAVDMLFRYMVYLMGGHPNAIAKTPEESLFAIDYFFATLGEPSKFSDAMNRTFFVEIKESIIARSNAKWEKFQTEFIFNHIFSSFVWYVLGEQLCRELKYIRKPTVFTRYLPHLYKLGNRLFSRQDSFDLPYNPAYAPDGAFMDNMKKLLKATPKEATVTFRAHDQTTADTLDYVRVNGAG